MFLLASVIVASIFGHLLCCFALNEDFYTHWYSNIGEGRAVLYAYFLSSCSWRVRAALKLKQIPFEERSIDIVKNLEQQSEQYRGINPAQKVPALHIDGVTLMESMAIIQYLEDTRPEPSLLPSTPLLRARMREIVETVVSSIQPLQNLGLKQHFDTEQQYQGLGTLESLLHKSAGRFCVGDQLTMADLCVVPQVFNAVTRHKLDISKYPTVLKLYETLLNEKVFNDTHPESVKRKR